MAELKFKYGPYANLYNANGSANTITTPIDEGTLYVTTDERAMFVDLKKPGATSAERIRIEGSVQYYDSVESFTNSTNPPYNQDTLYFFRKINSRDENVINALMAYNGTEWKQINVSLEAFEALSASVSTLSGATSTLSEDLTKLTARVEAVEKDIKDTIKPTLEEAVGNIATNLDSINGINKQLPTIKQDILGNTGSIDALETAAEGFSSSIEAHGEDIEDIKGRLGTAEGDIDKLESDVSGINIEIKGIKETLTTVKSNSEKITNLETNLRTLSDTVSEQGTAISGIQTKLNTLEDRVADNEEAIEAHGTEIESLWEALGVNPEGGTETGIGARLKTVEGKVETLEGSVEDLNEAVNALNNATDGRVTLLENRVTALDNETNGRVKSLENRVTALDKATDGRVAVLESDVSTAKTDIDNLEAKDILIDSAIKDLNDNKADKTEINELRTELTEDINDYIKSANAMQFKGTKASSSELPTTEVSIGDTWVMTGTGTYGGNDVTVEYAAGDFFIAQGEEGDDGYITGTITWNHVKSGYDRAFDPSIKTSFDSTNSKATMVLYNFAGEGLGAMSVKSDSKNVQLIASGEDTNKTVGISLVWDTF